MTNPAKRKGSSWETAIVTFLRKHGKRAQRIPAGAEDDQGDIFVGDPVWPAIQAKNCQRIELAGWVRDVNTQAVNASRTTGVVWIKKRGTTDPGHSYVVMDGYAFMRLMEGTKNGQ
jgi:Holliday junction resolvase